MENELFTLSDYAEDIYGKLVIIGTFDTIHGANVPTLHPMCALSLRLRFAKSELGKHSIAIRFIDPNGKEIQRLDGELEVKDPGSGADYVAINTVLRFSNLKLETFSKHSFELYIDGEWNKGLPLNYVKSAGQMKAA